MSRAELGALFDQLDVDGDGRISYPEFVRFMKLGGGEIGPGRMSADPMRPEALALAARDAFERVRELVKRCVRQGVDYRVFERHDPSHEGVIGRGAFRDALKELKAPLSESDVAHVERRFGVGGAGGRAADALGAGGGRAAGGGVAGSASDAGGLMYLEMLHTLMPTRGAAYGDAWRLEEKLRAMIKRRFQFWVPGKLKSAFRHFDTARKNRFGEGEFSSGLRALRLQCSAAQEHAVFEAMDLDRDGRVGYAEFCVFVRDPSHHLLANKLRFSLNRNKVAISNARAVFDELDKNASRLVGKHELARAFERLGVDLTASEAARLAARFDGTQTAT